MKSYTEHTRSGSAAILPLLLVALVTFYSTRSYATVTQSQDEQLQSESEYYDSAPKKGWYWYQDPSVTEEQQKPKEQQQAPDDRKYTKEELYNMYPDQFQELLKVRMKIAVQYPTEENVGGYLTMQDIARRKAAAFSSAVQFVTQKDAATLSVNDVYPGTTPGIEARVQMQKEEIFNTISSAQNNHAILFFWRPDCGFCEKQVGILKYFTDKYGWQIKPINITVQTGLAERFNITTTPTLLLIRQGSEKYMPISVGVISVEEMEQKLYRAIRYLNGDTDIDTFTNHDFEKGGSLDPKSILKNRKEGGGI
jgi:conjugal transfer pilus assembly protein TraF